MPELNPLAASLPVNTMARPVATPSVSSAGGVSAPVVSASFAAPQAPTTSASFVAPKFTPTAAPAMAPFVPSPPASFAIPVAESAPNVAVNPAVGAKKISFGQASQETTDNSGNLNRKIQDDKEAPTNQSKEEFLKALGVNAPSAGVAGADLAKENVDIYVMPKEFQHNKVAGGTGGGVVVIAVGVLLLIASVTVVYVYFFNQDLLKQFIGSSQVPVVVTTPVVTPIATPVKAPVAVPLPTVSTTPTSTTPTLPTISPQNIYIMYIQGLKSANLYQDYYNQVVLYGSKSKRDQASAEQALVKGSDSGAKALESVKQSVPTLSSKESYVEKIDANGTTAVLNITLSDNTTKGIINFVLEDNAWKVDTETWNLPSKPVTITAPVYMIAEDRDADGLTDAEEDLLGANKDSADTDKDGYTDGTEVLNLYNPNGKNKLVDNPAIKPYDRESWGLSILSPVKWSPVYLEQDATSGVVSFTSPDGQKISIYAVDNMQRENIDVYYLRVTNTKTFDPSQRISGEKWTGIMTTDGLSAYITNAKKTKIFKIAYEPEPTKVLSYIHIFQAMIKSLLLK